MLELNFNPFPLLQTQRLILRETTLDDAPEVFIQRSHPEIQKYIHRIPAVNIDDAKQFILRIAGQQKNKQSINWAITQKNNDLLIGNICLWNIDPEQCSAEVGYSLHPDFFNKGIMNEALVAVIKYGFKIMKARRIDAYTNKDNAASLKLLARNGFRRNLEIEKSLAESQVRTGI